MSLTTASRAWNLVCMKGLWLIKSGVGDDFRKGRAACRWGSVFCSGENCFRFSCFCFSLFLLLVEQ